MPRLCTSPRRGDVLFASSVGIWVPMLSGYPQPSSAERAAAMAALWAVDGKQAGRASEWSMAQKRDRLTGKWLSSEICQRAENRTTL